MVTVVINGCARLLKSIDTGVNTRSFDQPIGQRNCIKWLRSDNRRNNQPVFAHFPFHRCFRHAFIGSVFQHPLCFRLTFETGVIDGVNHRWVISHYAHRPARGYKLPRISVPRRYFDCAFRHMHRMRIGARSNSERGAFHDSSYHRGFNAKMLSLALVNFKQERPELLQNPCFPVFFPHRKRHSAIGANNDLLTAVRENNSPIKAS